MFAAIPERSFVSSSQFSRDGARFKKLSNGSGSSSGGGDQLVARLTAVWSAKRVEKIVNVQCGKASATQAHVSRYAR